jgi:hypothetical protein
MCDRWNGCADSHIFPRPSAVASKDLEAFQTPGQMQFPENGRDAQRRNPLWDRRSRIAGEQKKKGGRHPSVVSCWRSVLALREIHLVPIGTVFAHEILRPRSETSRQGGTSTYLKRDGATEGERVVITRKHHGHVDDYPQVIGYTGKNNNPESRRL